MTRFLRFSVLAIAAAIVFQAGSAHAVLITHYTFDEGTGANVIDNVGSNDAVADSGTIGWVDGLIGGAGDFNGSTDLIAPSILDTATAFTLTAWVNIDVTDGSYKGIFMSRVSNWGFAQDGGDNFDIRYDNAGGGSDGKDTPTGSESANVGEWVHLAQTWRNDGTGEYYLNGQPAGSKTGASTVFNDDAGDQNWFLGSDNGRNLNGQIDDIGIWMDEALPATEIERIYNNGLAGFPLTEPGTFVLGDVNGGGEVNSVDFEIIRNNFLKELDDRSDGDLVDNGIVDFADYAQWKQVTPKDPDPSGAIASVGVPEPSSILIVAAGVLGLGILRRI